MKRKDFIEDADFGAAGITPALMALLVAETVHGISEGRLQGLVAHREQGDGEGERASQQKQAWWNARAVGEALLPSVHGIVGDRPCDQVGGQDPLRDVSGEQQDDAGCRGAQYLPDTDLLDASLGCE
jgi:hypothetical protein